ncbi:MAG TPA: YetF domain-containing protein, partial [Bryobacteraceae bacterium]
AFVLVHRLLAYVSVYNDTIGRWVKGEASTLYADGTFNGKNMRDAVVSEKDLHESVRQEMNEDSLEHVKTIVQERTGEISVIKK